MLGSTGLDRGDERGDGDPLIAHGDSISMRIVSPSSGRTVAGLRFIAGLGWYTLRLSGLSLLVALSELGESVVVEPRRSNALLGLMLRLPRVMGRGRMRNRGVALSGVWSVLADPVVTYSARLERVRFKDELGKGCSDTGRLMDGVVSDTVKADFLSTETGVAFSFCFPPIPSCTSALLVRALDFCAEPRLDDGAERSEYIFGFGVPLLLEEPPPELGELFMEECVELFLLEVRLVSI
jgi:hypothetical protein